MIESKITGISNFSIERDSLIYLDNNSLKEKSLYLDNEKIQTKVGDFYVFGKLLLIGTWEPSAILFDIEKKSVVKVFEGFSCSPRTLTHKSFYLSKKTEKIRKRYIYNIETDKINEVDSIPIYNEANYECYSDDANNIINKTLGWTYSVGDNRSYHKILGHLDDDLFLYLPDYNVISLTKVDGKENWRVDGSSYKYSKERPIPMHFIYYRLDEKNKRLIHPLSEINLKGEISFTDYISLLKVNEEDNWFITHQAGFDFTDQSLVFSATRQYYDGGESGSKAECLIVIVDRKSNKLKAKYSLNRGITFDKVRKLIIKKNKIYVLEYGGTLSIFKIDDSLL